MPFRFKIFFFVFLFFFLIFFNLLMGPVSLFKDTLALKVFFEIRLPRVFAAILVGIALPVSGLSLQTMFRNPLAGPSVLGISSGASLGVAFFLLSGLNLGFLGVFPAAAIGAFGVSFLLLLFNRFFESPVVLLIIGLMLSSIVNAFINLLMFFSHSESLKAYVAWGMGSFSKLLISEVPLFLSLVLLGFLFVLFSIRYLNSIYFGSDFVQSLGLSNRFYQSMVLIGVSILTASTTVFCGPIAFLGLAVPHIAYAVFKSTNHRVLLPASILIGVNLSLLVSLFPQIPLNAVMSLLGVPVVFIVLFRSSQTIR